MTCVRQAACQQRLLLAASSSEPNIARQRYYSSSTTTASQMSNGGAVTQHRINNIYTASTTYQQQSNGTTPPIKAASTTILSDNGDYISEDSAATTMTLGQRIGVQLRRCVHGYVAVWNHVKYPLIVLLLLALTTLSVSMVLVNTLQLLFGFRALPVYVQYVNVEARHTFGIVGAFVEIVIILWVDFIYLRMECRLA